MGKDWRLSENPHAKGTKVFLLKCFAIAIRYPFPVNILPLQHQIQITEMKELQEQLTTVQHEVKQRQLRCQKLGEHLKLVTIAI